jgi:hypothetical protein
MQIIMKELSQLIEEEKQKSKKIVDTSQKRI